jgi:hypothetical protein
VRDVTEPVAVVVMLARMEVDPGSELRERRSEGIGVLSVQRPDDTVIGVHESRCWR